MISRQILGLASAANEKVIAYRDMDYTDEYAKHCAARDLTEAVDALTGAIAEEANK